jgi:hypothetical protein
VLKLRYQCSAGQLLNCSNPVLVPPVRAARNTMTEMLDEAARRLDSAEFANQPAVKAELEDVRR